MKFWRLPSPIRRRLKCALRIEKLLDVGDDSDDESVPYQSMGGQLNVGTFHSLSAQNFYVNIVNL